MGGAVDWTKETPERGGGAVAQDRNIATCEDGGHPTPMPAQASVPHGVDAAVDAVELTSSGAVSYRSRP